MDLLAFLGLKTASPAGNFEDMLKVVLLLSFSGMCGGLALHLIHNKGKVVMPDKANGNLGVLADLLVGIISGNAIHLIAASILDYDHIIEFNLKTWLNMMSLGILAGFGGSTMLIKLSRTLEDMIAKEIKELHADVQENRQILVTAQSNVSQTMANQYNILYYLSLNVMRDLLALRVYPDTDRLKIIEALIGFVNQRDPATWTLEEKLALAAYHMWQRENDIALDFLKQAEGKDQDHIYAWAINNMSGICQYGKNSYDAALGFFNQALEHATSVEQKSATQIQMASLYLDLDKKVMDKSVLDKKVYVNDAIQLVDEVLNNKERFSEPLLFLIEKGRMIRAMAVWDKGEVGEAIKSLNEIQQPNLLQWWIKDTELNCAFVRQMLNEASVQPHIKKILSLAKCISSGRGAIKV